MVMLWSLFGLSVAIYGVFLYRRGRKAIGGLLVVVGGSLFTLGAIALLRFHPA
jgi:hypothetical protein